MNRQTGIEHMKDGNIKLNERFKNFFQFKGMKTDMEVVREEVDDEVRFEIASNEYFRELEKRELSLLNDIKSSCEKQDDDDIPEAFWRV